MALTLDHVAAAERAAELLERGGREQREVAERLRELASYLRHVARVSGLADEWPPGASAADLFDPPA